MSAINGLLARSAQFGELCRVETRQHGDGAALGAVELGEGLADACVDLIAVVLDVLADRGVDHVLLRPVEEMRRVRDQRVGLDINFDGSHSRSHFATSSLSTKVPVELKYR